MVSKASEDLPDPDSPVMTTSLSRGIETSTFFRLCSRAPRTRISREGLPPAPPWRLAFRTSSIPNVHSRVWHVPAGPKVQDWPNSKTLFSTLDQLLAAESRPEHTKNVVA